MRFERVICIVLDGCGAGSAPDAHEFNDIGENEGHTLKNLYEKVGNINAPLLKRMGFFASAGVPYDKVEAAYGRLQPVSKGKDTMTGHWEMMGINLEKPFPTYPNGFPNELIEQFESKIGTKTLGHKPESGTEVIKRLGEQHMQTGFPIVYTSADSVFQIACHEEIVSIQKLYEYCTIARELLKEPHNIARVIARPFIGNSEKGFTRTERRKDFPIPPPHNLLDTLQESIGPTFGIGVIPEIFNHRGFVPVERTQTNKQHYQLVKQAINSPARFIWANFEDFDMLHAHRNDTIGFANALEEFDQMLSDIVSNMQENELLILTADHGNDPTTPSTDHSREYVPFCLWHSQMKQAPLPLNDLLGFAHIGATIAEALNVPFHTRNTILENI